MKTLLTLIILTMSTIIQAQTIYQFKTKTLEGQDFDFASLKGQKIMIVNTASKCGFTDQYKELEALYQQYKNQHFVIIGFPCNDFMGQEPGNSSEIREFCTKNYGVTFPLMEKIEIATSPVYKWLKNKDLNGVASSKVSWNFNKYLIDENGHFVKHIGSTTKPNDTEITNWIEGKTK
ncbi:MAG: glutathione peroxidase [Bacteroidetes bacterium]|nr:glutathione peroxidase [Bacteroidota bacterium]